MSVCLSHRGTIKRGSPPEAAAMETDPVMLMDLDVEVHEDENPKGT